MFVLLSCYVSMRVNENKVFHAVYFLSSNVWKIISVHSRHPPLSSLTSRGMIVGIIVGGSMKDENLSVPQPVSIVIPAKQGKH